jgi:hypothetical protein
VTESVPGEPAPATMPALDTVEALVREQLGKAMGGRRGVLEAAVPTIVFTVVWLSTKRLEWALGVSVSAAVVLLIVRLVQRSTVQFVVNALVGIGIGWLFVRLAARSGGDEDAQALAYFLPGLLYNAGYAVVLALTCLIGWPLMGFMVGSVMGDATAWRQDRQIVSLCTKLTWLLAVPCALRVVVQVPIWLAGKREALDPDAALAALGVLKIAMGWPLQIAALTAVGWTLMRNRTPIARPSETAASE